MSSNAMEQLYQQVIMDHARFPHGRGLVAADGPHVGESHQVNPTCGDEVTMRVTLDESGTRLREVTWEGQGCSISQASVSVLHDLVDGADLATVDGLAASFRALMQAQGAGLDEAAEDALGDATAFTGVARYPARVKCALLGWAALTDALIRAGREPAGQEEDA